MLVIGIFVIQLTIIASISILFFSCLRYITAR
jgi:hypothetical protein